MFHADHDSVAAHAQHQPFSLGNQMYDDAMLVLEPRATPTRRATRRNHSGPEHRVVWEVADVPEPAGNIVRWCRLHEYYHIRQAVFPALPDAAIAKLPIVLADMAQGRHVRAPISEAQARFVVGFADHAAPAAPVALFSTPSEPPRQGPR